MKRTLTPLLSFCLVASVSAQDTFSIAAVDTITGEVGSAGASCLDLFQAGFTDPGFLAQQLPGVGTINSQSFYLAANQNNAMTRMQAGDTPQQIMDWLAANDVQGNSTQRQYGAVRLVGSGALAAAFTGANCLSYANHITGPNYAIQGNILLGQQILDDMEQNFLNTPGTLADKLMAALQGANVPRADTRCTTTSSLFAFLEVAKPTDPFNQPSLKLGVRLRQGTTVEPIDSLQRLYDRHLSIGDAGERTARLVIAPNPTDGAINVVLPRAAATGDEVLVLDAAGRTVHTERPQAGSSRLTIGLEGLAPGAYQLVLRGGGDTVTGSFVRD